jgi:hypothetical protein
MQKSYLHNGKSLIKEDDKYKLIQGDKNFIKKVDINILLNRVKLNEINKKKKNIIFIFSVLLSLSLFSYILIAQ